VVRHQHRTRRPHRELRRASEAVLEVLPELMSGKLAPRSK